MCGAPVGRARREPPAGPSLARRADGQPSERVEQGGEGAEEHDDPRLHRARAGTGQWSTRATAEPIPAQSRQARPSATPRQGAPLVNSRAVVIARLARGSRRAAGVPRTKAGDESIAFSPPNSSGEYDARLLSGFGVVGMGLPDQTRDEGAEQRLAPAASVVDELEEAEVERQLLLR